MSQVSLFDVYVRRRLDAWGREFALHRDAEILGHKSKDMLQILIEHKGEMPPRPTGWRPLLIPPTEMQIEDIVREVAAASMTRATVLRAYYCGCGRRGVERFETANQILVEMALPALSRRGYFKEHEIGVDAVSLVLSRLARARAWV